MLWILGQVGGFINSSREIGVRPILLLGRIGLRGVQFTVQSHPKPNGGRRMTLKVNGFLHLDGRIQCSEQCSLVELTLPRTRYFFAVTSRFDDFTVTYLSVID